MTWRIERALEASKGQDVEMITAGVKRIPREEVWISISV
jgi:hypothetical protein